MGPTTVAFGSPGAFADQAIVGASLPVPSVPSLSATLEYRNFGSARANVSVTRTISAAIAIAGFGETHLLVPTGPNVREPQNRRVEIIIQ